ncbi:MAG: matrixin family metalloprotease [Vulcanimicrobiota bacterium]
MKCFCALALLSVLACPASAQAGGTINMLDLMRSSLNQAGLQSSPLMRVVESLPELQQMSFPSGYSIPNLPGGGWTELVNGQLSLPSGLNAFPPSPLPGSPLLPAEIKTSDLPGQPVEHYGCMHSGGYVCRFPSEKLPLKVYSPLSERRAVVDQSIAMWNESSRKSLKTDLFSQVTDPAQAQIRVDWTGVNLPVGAAGVTPYTIYYNRVKMGEIGVSDRPELKESDLVEVLSHELGHSLGLEHSADSADLMYPRHTLNTQHGHALTQRDAWMVSWLYSQKTGIPLVVE